MLDGLRLLKYAATVDDELISEAEARALFAPYLPLLSDCLMSGWVAWEAVRSTPQGRPLGKSARARIVWDHATRRAEDLFDSMSEVGKARVHGLLILDFSLALLRFKKLDNNLQTRGIPTRQQQLFADQAQTEMQQLSLWRPVPMIVAGYLLDRLETGIDRLVLVLLRHGQVLWQIDLPPSAGMPVALPPAGDQPRPATPRSTRPKPSEDEEAE